MKTDTPHSVALPPAPAPASAPSSVLLFQESLRDLLSKSELNPAFRQEGQELAGLPLSRESAEDTLRFAQRLKAGESEACAAGVFALLAGLEAFPEVSTKARSELNAMLGQGAAGQRLEYLGSRFLRDLGDYRSIVPMLGAGIAGEFLGAATFSRFSAAGWGMNSSRLGAATIGFLGESTVFAGLRQGLRPDPNRSFATEWASAALTLGVFKGVGLLESGALRAGMRLSPAVAMNRAVEKSLLPALHQGSLLAGLWAVHGLESSVGLRPESSSDTTFADLLSESLNLQIGGRLAHALVPGAIPRFQQEAEWRRLLSLEKFQPILGAPFLVGLSACSDTKGSQGGHPAIGWGILGLAAGLGLYGAYRSRKPVPPKIGEYFFMPSPFERTLLQEFFWMGKVPEVISWTTWQKIQSRVLVQARLMPPRKYDKIPFTWKSHELQNLVVEVYSRKEAYDLRMSSYVTEDPFPSPRKH